MSELNENFINVYIKRQEDNVLYHLRKQIEAETKVVILEANIVEKTKQIEELEKQIEVLNKTVSEAIAGLQAVSVEKQKLEERLSVFNGFVVEKHTIQEMQKKLDMKDEAYRTLKNNYDLVLNAKKKPRKKKEEPKKQEEWVTDGD